MANTDKAEQTKTKKERAGSKNAANQLPVKLQTLLIKLSYFPANIPVHFSPISSIQGPPVLSPEHIFQTAKSTPLIEILFFITKVSCMESFFHLRQSYQKLFMERVQVFNLSLKFEFLLESLEKKV